MKILAHGHYSATVDESLPPLKELVKETTGEAVRRVGRFIQLALIGAGRCLQGVQAPPDTAVYLTSGRGDLEITLEVLEQMVEHGLPPKPLSFINTVSNSACFYLAKHFALHGRSHFVTRRHAPLESVLQLALLDMAEGSVQTALLGSVDICTAPLSDHRKRLAVESDTTVGEGSHWFLLAQDEHPARAIGRIIAVETLADEQALRDWLAIKALDSRDTVFAAGQHVTAASADALQADTGMASCFTPTASLPWYDSHCGHTLGQFLTQQPARQLLHIDRDASGRYNVLLASLP
jgi:hypothetical protein